MTPALRAHLNTATASEYLCEREYADELFALVQAHYAGDRLAYELVSLIEYFDLSHLAGSTGGS